VFVFPAYALFPNARLNNPHSPKGVGETRCRKQHSLYPGEKRDRTITLIKYKGSIKKKKVMGS
jgi:hypothetical protein